MVLQANAKSGQECRLVPARGFVVSRCSDFMMGVVFGLSSGAQWVLGQKQMGCRCGANKWPRDDARIYEKYQCSLLRPEHESFIRNSTSLIQRNTFHFVLNKYEPESWYAMVGAYGYMHR